MKIRGAHDQNTEHRVQFCLFCIGPLVGGDVALAHLDALFRGMGSPVPGGVALVAKPLKKITASGPLGAHGALERLLPRVRALVPAW